MDKISYSAVILDNQSRTKLIQRFKNDIPDDWKIIADHMTIMLGPLPDDMQSEIGKQVTLTATGFKINDMVAAVAVSGYPLQDKTPHITIAVNEAAGGRPRMSKDITEFNKINPITLIGYIKEVPFELQESLDGFENDVEYFKTGNEGPGVKTFRNPSSANDKSYGQGGLNTLQPTTGTSIDMRECVTFKKSDLLKLIND